MKSCAGIRVQLKLEMCPPVQSLIKSTLHILMKIKLTSIVADSQDACNNKKNFL